MTQRRILKIMVYYAAILISLNIIWIVVLYTAILPNYFIKTEVTVIDISKSTPISARGGRQTNHFPTYEYLDDKDDLRTHESDDGFNVINGLFFNKETGDKLTGYYEKGSNNGIFVTGTGDWWTFLMGPLMIGIFPGGLIPAALIYSKSGKNSKLAK